MPVRFALQKLFQGRLECTFLVPQNDSDFSIATITMSGALLTWPLKESQVLTKLWETSLLIIVKI